MQTIGTLKLAFEHLFETNDDVQGCWDDVFLEHCRNTFTYNSTEFIVYTVPYGETDGESQFIVGVLLGALTVNKSNPLCFELRLTNEADKLKNHELYGPLIQNKHSTAWIVQIDCGDCYCHFASFALSLV